MTTLEDKLKGIRSKYPEGFIDLLRFIMAHEVVFMKGHYGDYDNVKMENDPKDPGGRTKYGIDQRSHKEVVIENLTFEASANIYYKTIWTPLRVDDLKPLTAMVLCDAAVNCGNERAVMWMQRLVKVDDDGNIGPITIEAANSHDDKELAKQINARRLYYYEQEVRQSLRAEYLTGWRNRMRDLNAALG
jgi:lysozyme family protein